jgi:hypothetical protein
MGLKQWGKKVAPVVTAQKRSDATLRGQVILRNVQEMEILDVLDNSRKMGGNEPRRIRQRSFAVTDSSRRQKFS